MGVAGALLEAAARGDAARLASILNADARDVDATDEIGRTALQRAAAEGHVQSVQLLLRYNADVNKQDHVYGNTAAHEASWKGYSVTVGVVARAGADLRVLNAAGFSPLHFACQNGHNQSTREILLAGAPPDLQNTYGDTALHTAARYGHAGVTRILLSAQCRVSEPNRNGDTALHIAAAMGRRKLTRILLEAGCDKGVRNSQGETARDIATRKGLEEIVQILNTPVKQMKKKREKSRERTIDEPEKKDRNKKKKNVHFEKPARVVWSPYGCHYYPDPKMFPKPRLSSLPADPLRKGEQYYVDLAGNIKKGPIGVGYTCYCAPFFKHIEDKLDEDKRDLKRHIDRAHEKLDRKVTDLETRTQDKITILTRAVGAECGSRWAARGGCVRASARIPRPYVAPALQRSRSLEPLDDGGRDDRPVRRADGDCETTRSTDVLDRRSPSPLRPRHSHDVSAEVHAERSRPQWRSDSSDERRRSVRELVARVERSMSPPPPPPPPPPHGILKTPQQPQRPAPVLKDKPPRSKRFSLHNLIPFPTRKAIREPDASESSEDETPPAPTPLLQTLPLPNYEAVAGSPRDRRPVAGSPGDRRPIAGSPGDRRPVVPKDAYFHEIPNRVMPYRVETEPPRGVFDAMMQDHLLREMDGSWLHERLQTLAIDTRLAPPGGLRDRDSHNDSGYSTKVYSAAGSSQGPSPSLSHHQENGHLPNGKPILPLAASSLV